MGAFTFALMLTLAGCIPSGPDYISDYDVVYANHDPKFDFSAVHTYLMPDSVMHEIGSGQNEDHTYDAAILSALETNLNALGWTRLAETGEPADVVILPRVSQQTYGSCASYCWYCYWGYWPGWGYYPPAWGPGWGWGYPPGMVCTSYNTGTLAVSMTAPGKAENNTLPIVWVGILNGLLEGSSASIGQRITTNINQMFVQSPYLGQ